MQEKSNGRFNRTLSLRPSKVMIRGSLIGFIIGLCLVTLLANAQMRKEDLPFSATIDLLGVEESKKVGSGALFGFLICLHADETAIKNIQISVFLPPEVQNLGGGTLWKGDLDLGAEACLNIGLKTAVEMAQWSEPLHAEMRFIYQGITVTRNVTWTAKGLEDTGFLSERK